MITKTKTNWRKVKLGEAVDIIDGDRGSNYPKKEELLKGGFCVFLDAKNVSGTKFDFNSAQFITERKNNSMRKGQLERGDFVLTTRGTVGNIAYYDTDIPYNCMRINSGMVILRPRHEIIIDDFFYSFLISREFRDQIEALKTGSAQPQLPIRDLKLFEIEIPPVPNQKRIAGILSAFDDKIELNNKISAALEQIAQVIFKEWFVKNSKIKNQKLGDLASISYGRGPSSSQLKKVGYPVYGANGVIGYFDSYNFSDRQIIVGCRGVVGNVTLTPPQCIVTHNSLIITPKDSRKTFFYYLLRNQNLDAVVGGSAQPQITINDLEKLELLLPEEKLQDKFESIAGSVEQKRLMIFYENQKLAALRDLLLPKLMSGEIRV